MKPRYLSAPPLRIACARTRRLQPPFGRSGGEKQHTLSGEEALGVSGKAVPPSWGVADAPATASRAPPAGPLLSCPAALETEDQAESRCLQRRQQADISEAGTAGTRSEGGCGGSCFRSLAIALHVLVENLPVVHGDEAEAGVVALLRGVARGETGVGRRPEQAAVAPGPLEGLNVPGQGHSFT